MNKRVRYFDIAKGILILLLLLHHYGSARTRLFFISNDYYDFFNQYQIIFTAFFMQAFFIISGICSNFEKPFKPFFINQIKQLIVPWVSFEIIVTCFYAIRTDDFTSNFILSQIFNKTWTFLWFLNALFFSKMVVWIINKRTKSSWVLLLVTFVFLVVGIIINQNDWGRNILCIRESMGSCLFVAIGHVLKNRLPTYNLLLKYCIFIYPLVIAFILILGKNVPVFTAGMHISLRALPVFLVTSLTGTFACLRICKLIDHNNFFEFWGQSSLIVYCIHFSGMIIFVEFYYRLLSPLSLYNVGLYYSLIFLSEIVYCWVMVNIFSSKYLKWTIGKF